MPRNKSRYIVEDRDKIEKANRIEELENLVESHNRTQRHLQEHSEIVSPEKINQSREKQADREFNIEILKDKIISGQQTHSIESEDLERNYSFAKGYMEHNKEHMNRQALENMKEKQQNRRDKMSGLT